MAQWLHDGMLRRIVARAPPSSLARPHAPLAATTRQSSSPDPKNNQYIN